MSSSIQLTVNKALFRQSSVHLNKKIFINPASISNCCSSECLSVHLSVSLSHHMSVCTLCLFHVANLYDSLSHCMSAWPFASLSVPMSVCPSVCILSLSVLLSHVCIFVPPSDCPNACLFIRMSVCSYVCLSLYQSVCLSVPLSICSLVCLSISRSWASMVRHSVSLSSILCSILSFRHTRHHHHQHHHYRVHKTSQSPQTSPSSSPSPVTASFFPGDELHLTITAAFSHHFQPMTNPRVIALWRVAFMITGLRRLPRWWLPLAISLALCMAIRVALSRQLHAKSSLNTKPIATLWPNICQISTHFNSTKL